MLAAYVSIGVPAAHLIGASVPLTLALALRRHHPLLPFPLTPPPLLVLIGHAASLTPY